MPIEDAIGWTSLHYAAQYNRIEEVSSIVSQPKSILWLSLDAKSHAGITPLHVAASHGHIEIVKLLLDAGASVNAKSSTNNLFNPNATPLQLASCYGHADVVQLLLERGADKTELQLFDVILQNTKNKF